MGIPTAVLALLFLLLKHSTHHITTTHLYNNNLDSVSDAEALLACRAYLQKKNRLGQWNQRRPTTRYTSFWEDASELNTEEQLETEIEEKEQQDFGESIASEQFINFSKAAQARWADPEFRTQWYQNRWGNRRQDSDTRMHVLKQRLQQVNPEEFLRYPALAAMTEEEIEEAIEMYIESGKQRSQTRKKRKSQIERKSKLELLSDPNYLQEMQRKRSERAKKAYENRKEQRTVELDTVGRNLAIANTPSDAVLKIQADIQAGKRPSIDDVQLMLQPAKLAKRKEVLRLILSECFELRGKCVPVEKEDGTITCRFVTHCSIQELGDFVIDKLAM